jgi:hypothetical protein
MQRKILFVTLIVLLTIFTIHSQTLVDSATIQTGVELKGLVLDEGSQAPLPYANIFVLHKNMGVISNETGHFSIDISGLDKTDTVRFQYIGFQTRNLILAELDSASLVYLKEDIINLREILVFGSEPDPKAIVKKVLENKDANYKKTSSKSQVFIRERDIAAFTDIHFKLKKSSITQLDKEMIALVEEKIPRQTISYTDFLGNIYQTKNTDDSVKLKVDPLRAVSLKEKDMSDLEQIADVFEGVFRDIGEEEYWKVKSGLFSKKLDDDEMGSDTTGPENDTLEEKGRILKYYARKVNYQLRYTLMDEKDDWEFLYKTGKYNYTLAGGSRVNGEDVYIIDFTPKSSGNYIGRLFVAINTYALIRADYEYAEGKTGRDFHLFGVGYTETHFKGSIYFEKKNDNYVLKYFSKKAKSSASFDRNVALIKKKERFLFDKKLNEIKVGIDIALDMESSIEYLVLEQTEIQEKQFSDFKQKERMEVIYVDQFDKNLWKGFDIIEPTEQMREYKKHEAK